MHITGYVLAAVWLLQLNSGCTTLQPLELTPETALAPASTTLWTELAALQQGDWFHLLNTGEEALQWRLRAIDSAGQSLDLQTFLWKEDATGLSLLRHILMAADRGVRIRMLLDDAFTINEDDVLFAIARHPHIEIRIYNPFAKRVDSFVLRQLLNLGEFSRLDHRMHNKAMTVDNRAAILGGRNLADEYFGNHVAANFRDMEVLVGGPVVQAISQRFDQYWNSGWSFPVENIPTKPLQEQNLFALRDRLAENIPYSVQEDPAARLTQWRTAARSASTGQAQLHADEPAQIDPATEFPQQLAQDLRDWIESAREELIVVSAYLIPTHELEAAIERAEDRGVQVRILTNSLRSNNHTAAHSAYRHHIHRLMGHGADLHEMRALAKDRSVYMRVPVEQKELGLHAKLLVIDHDLVFIGSANLDPRSLRLNTEMGLLIRSASFNRRLREKLDIDFHKRNAWHLQMSEDGTVHWVADDIILAEQPAGSFMQRLEDWFLGLLPMEEEL